MPHRVLSDASRWGAGGKRGHDIMGIRRLARERAIQFLYQVDLNPPDKMDKAMDRFWATHGLLSAPEENAGAVGQPRNPESADAMAVRAFSDPLISGTLKHREEIDAELARYSKNWKLHRIAAVDRNILRLAIYEMRYREDIPPIVTINEAIDLAKRFSTDESGKFINGILERVKQETMRPARVAS